MYGCRSFQSLEERAMEEIEERARNLLHLPPTLSAEMSLYNSVYSLCVSNQNQHLTARLFIIGCQNISSIVTKILRSALFEEEHCCLQVLQQEWRNLTKSIRSIRLAFSYLEHFYIDANSLPKFNKFAYAKFLEILQTNERIYHLFCRDAIFLDDLRSVVAPSSLENDVQTQCNTFTTRVMSGYNDLEKSEIRGPSSQVLQIPKRILLRRKPDSDHQV
jgi:hypothetical protein